MQVTDSIGFIADISMLKARRGLPVFPGKGNGIFCGPGTSHFQTKSGLKLDSY